MDHSLELVLSSSEAQSMIKELRLAFAVWLRALGFVDFI
jgi:hypothetical protein